MKDITISQIDADEIKRRGIEAWPTWSSEVASFDWRYDERETSLILEGEVLVSTADDQYHLKAGDLVVFRAGLECHWDVKKPLRKHYQMG